VSKLKQKWSDVIAEINIGVKDRRLNQPSKIPLEKGCQLIPVVINSHDINSFNNQMSSKKTTQCSSENGFPGSGTASLSDCSEQLQKHTQTK
jgi:hypothetical protein